MGYRLTIGELVVEYDQDEYFPEVRLDAKFCRHVDLPRYNEEADQTNSRDPAYAVWRSFCENFGLLELFYGINSNGDVVREDNILRSHSGCIPLTEIHRKDIDAALASHRKKHPNVIPEFNGSVESGALVRLEWLQYWIGWALDNCERPVFVNS